MITLFDIPSKHPQIAWSPNTFRTRILLHYKGLPFKTQWVEYPDIEPTLRQLGALPTSTKEDGSDYYTLPVIHDDSTGRYISDSANIAEYLDETYPSTPPLFPPNSRAAIGLFRIHVWKTVGCHLVPLVMYPACSNLNPRSEEFFRRTREESFKCKMEEIAPAGPTRDGHWQIVKDGLTFLSGCISKNGPESLFFLGDTFSFADAVLVSNLMWAKRVLHENEEWQFVEGWRDGRWSRLLATTKEYQTVLG